MDPILYLRTSQPNHHTTSLTLFNLGPGGGYLTYLWFIGVTWRRFPLVQRIEMCASSKTRSIRRDRIHMNLQHQSRESMGRGCYCDIKMVLFLQGSAAKQFPLST